MRRTKSHTANSSGMGALLGGAVIGALAMYFSDPERGKRRRALTRDKMQRAMVRGSSAMDAARRDLNNRVLGVRARTMQKMGRSRSSDADDAVLAARVRSRIGRAIAHPHPVSVMVEHGRATLSGPILRAEHEALVRAATHVPGVHEVIDSLTVHETAEGIPALQGNPTARRSASIGTWPPGLRALATAGGGMLAMYGMRKHGIARALLGSAGIGLLARSLGNRPLMARGAGGAMHMTKTIHIMAGPEQVYDMWSDYKNFPHFMSQVEEVRDLGEGRSRWKVHGPAGSRVEWDAVITARERPHKLAWRTEEDSPVQHSGEVHFEEELSGTRVSVHLSYHPPAGMLGHAAATLFGGNPKRQMDEDLMRMKAYIESGIPPHDAARPMPPLGLQSDAQPASGPNAQPSM